MKNRLFFSVLFLSFFTAVSGNSANPSADEKLEKLPLLFRQNMGQWDEQILFSGSSGSANVYFMKNELSFGLMRPVKNEKLETEQVMAAGRSMSEIKALAERKFNNQLKTPEYEYLVWNVRFEGAQAHTLITAEGKTGSNANYFIGNDPAKHAVNVPDYKILTYKNIYKNIDLKYYGSSNHLKYDFVIRSHANVSDIRMNYAGISRIRINEKGELILSASWGEIKEEAPYTYQYVEGVKTEVRSAYTLLNDSTVGFKILQDYDKSRELIIDPIVLDWATFVSGSISAPSMAGQVSKIAMDTLGNVYAVGSFNSTFPTTPGSYSSTFGGGNQDVYVYKLNPTGTALVYSTYIGGNQWDNGANLYLNDAGEVYVTGQTSSFNWPTLNAYDNSFNGSGDVFVAKLNATGSALLFSTFVGGSGSDAGADITLDPFNNIYVAGNTSSSNFPTSPGAFSSTLKGYSDLIVFKLNPAGNSLLYATLVGSSKNETGVGIGVNAAGEATVGGNCDSTDFPVTPGAFDLTNNDAPNVYNMKGDMVVFRLNANASSLIYATYLGSNVGDFMMGFDVNSNDEAYVSGVILFGTNYPTTPGTISTTVSIWNSFVTRLNNTGTGLIFSTFFATNTSQLDEVRDLYVNSSNEVYVAGDGGSYNQFPVTTTACTTCKGGEDIFAAKINPSGTAVLWATYVGSKDWDVCQAIAMNKVNCAERIAIGFNTNSFIFPTTPGVFQPNKLSTDSTNTHPGIMMFKDAIAVSPAYAGSDVTICSGENVTLAGTGGGTSYAWNPGGQSTTSISVSPTATTTYTFTLTNACGTTHDSVEVFVVNAINASISGDTSLCTGQSSFLTASGGSGYVWNTGETTASITVIPSASSVYSVVVTSGSCAADTDSVTVMVSLPPVISIAGNAVVCTGQSSTLTASGGNNYVWNTGATSSSLTISPTANTTYTVTVTNSGGCSATATQSVSILPGITSGLTSTQTSCTVNNGTATVNASAGTPPYTYSWSNGQISQVATGLGAGTYTVIISDTGGCSDTQTVSVTSTSNLSATTTSTQTGCSVNNGTATANAASGTAPYTYNWSNGQTTQTATGLAAGNYSATVTDANGCTVSSTATVTATPGPTATAAVSTVTVTLGGSTSITATGGGTYQWSPAAGLSCTTCSNPTATPAQTTDYCVVVTDANGCTDSACITVYVDIPCGALYIPNAFSPNNDLDNDLECVFGNCIADMHLTIFTRWGEMVFESRDQKVCWDGTYKGELMGSAVFSYFLNATMTNGEKISKKGNVSLVR